MNRSTADAAAPAALLDRLGLHGLSHLDAPLLAALATETPLLLIGPHGSAKSALLERLAAALGLEHRHYNASLLSFDDLVGFPVPQGDGLQYLRTPATLWDAQSIFLDEISRCRPEVQNKLFSIVHEKRVQGLPLLRLRYRWAAMNPPACDDPDAADDDLVDQYAGSMALDVALADRFGMVVSLPALEDLSPQARRAVIRSGLPTPGHAIDHGVDATLVALVARCRAALPAVTVRHGEWITTYVAALAVPLRQAGLGISGRRAALLAAAVAAVHAARGQLDGRAALADPSGVSADMPALEDSALMALRHALPHRAQGRSIDAGVLATLHRRAVDEAGQAQADDGLGAILDEADPVRRVGLALAALRARPALVPRSTMSLLVSDALAGLPRQARWVLTQELLPEVAVLDAVDAPTLELLAGPFQAQVTLERDEPRRHQVPRARMAGFNALVAALGALDASDPQDVALGNLGSALYAADEGASDPASLQRQRASLRGRLWGEATP